MAQRELALLLDFEAHGLPGQVRVSHGVNSDPVNTGMNMLGLDDGTGSWARGFPTVEASVQYSGDGYKMVMGWIQTIRVTQTDGSVKEMVDGPPQMSDVDHPFCTWGPCPTLFDAPATSDRPVPLWRADAFLTVSPDALMTKVVQPVCAFHWGYVIADDGTVTSQWPTSDGTTSWRDIVPLLRTQYPNWTFFDVCHTPSRKVV